MYFKRPIVPVLQSVPPEVVMQIPEATLQQFLEPIPEQKTRTIEIQTMFRESEAQTDPFTPDYVVDRGVTPEVLTIAHLKFGRGLPASMAEMEFIEQIREKKAFENALPPISDEACFTLRRKLMEEQEVREWKKREDDIKKLQNEKLNLLQSALLEREKETEEKNAQRTEEIRLKKTESKEKQVAKIQRKRIKILRKMFKARKDVDNKEKKRDIIEEYANFGSEVYAPITRKGLSLDKKANKYEVQPEALATFQGLNDLSNALPKKVFDSKVSVQQIKQTFQKSLSRKEVSHRQALSKAQGAINISKQPSKKERAESDMDEFSLKKIQVRPDTPDYEVIAIDKSEQEREDKRQAAILLLQRLLRGRATQNMMFEGKEKRLDLIAELRATEEWKETADLEEEKALIQNYQERILDGVAEAMQGEIIAKTLDTISKELVRLKQERRIAAMVKLAERDRRRREAEESGRREAEVVLRQREDVLFRELMSVHQGTVDSYLQNILTSAIDSASTAQAFEEATIKVGKLNQLVDTLESRMNRPEVVVRDLVSTFLIPDVQRRKLERQVHFEEKRFTETARKIIQNSIQHAGAKLENENALAFEPKTSSRDTNATVANN